MKIRHLVAALALALPAPLVAQGGHEGHGAHHGAATDTTFAGVQRRGKVVMGVDQYTSTHRFDDLADGGRILLERDAADSAGSATIRAHLRAIAAAFAAGDFSAPAVVHMREVPGTRVMAERRDAIRYAVTPLPRGAELRITTTDPAALAAVRQFLAFQRADHRAAGRAMH